MPCKKSMKHGKGYRKTMKKTAKKAGARKRRMKY